MDLQNLGGILNHFGQDDAWRQQRLFQMLVQQWHQLVGDSVAQHTRPTGIHLEVLQVAASTPVWAQNLSFERRRILLKIQQLPQLRSLQLKDIHFSTAQWHTPALDPDQRLDTNQQQTLWQQHPSRLPQVDSALLPTGLSFEQWQMRRQQQNQTLPSCPRCQCPTPQGELQRWSVCAFCATQRWQAEKISNELKEQ